MVVVVIMMPSIDGLGKRSLGKRQNKVHKTPSTHKKTLIKKHCHQESKIINQYFLPTKQCNTLTKEDSTTSLENASHLQNQMGQGNSNELNRAFIKEEDVCSESTSNVGILKMSPYRGLKQLNDAAAFNGSGVESCNQTSDQSYSIQTKKIKQPIKQPDKKITEFYPVRRSSRKTKSVIKKEKDDKLLNAILSNQENGLEVIELPNKGRGVVATRKFARDEFVVEYAGDLIMWPEAKERERFYATDSSIGCYMYYFNAKGQNYCIDATSESGRLGRLLNHSRKNPNCYTKLVWVPNSTSHRPEPRLVILAKRDVDSEEELTYDYGDRDKAALQVHPWLKT